MASPGYFDEQIGENSDSDSDDNSSSDDVEDGVEGEGEGEGAVQIEDENEDNEEDTDEDTDEDEEGINGQSGGADDEDDEDEENNEKLKKIKKIPGKIAYSTTHTSEPDDDEDDDDDGEMYLQKFDKDVNDNYIVNFHPECVLQNYDEILAMIKVVRDADDIIIDDLHKTIPYLTKYEKARILGQRAKQINSGALPFVKVPENVIDGYLIAELELKEKRIPFIIRRPLPNGGSEYWSIRDLENIIF
jgi:DNA-directed RNA polymerase I, II, and III subunit RPABC2